MNLVTSSFRVEGMSCQGCVASVTRALKAVSGVTDVAVSLNDKCATVRYDEAEAAPAALVAAIEDAGFDAEISE